MRLRLSLEVPGCFLPRAACAHSPDVITVKGIIGGISRSAHMRLPKILLSYGFGPADPGDPRNRWSIGPCFQQAGR